MIEAPESYDRTNEQRFRTTTLDEIRRRQRVGEPVEIQSPNGTWYRLTVDDTGALGTEPA